MGIFDIFSSSSKGETIVDDPVADHDKGLFALKEFHNYCTSHYSENYTFTYQQLLDQITSMQKFGIDGIGQQINVNEMSDSKVSSAMKALGDKGQGKIPSKPFDFTRVLIDQAVDVSFLELAAGTVVMSAGDVVKGAQQVGNSVLFTGKILLYALPVAVIFIVYMRTKKLAEG